MVDNEKNPYLYIVIYFNKKKITKILLHLFSYEEKGETLTIIYKQKNVIRPNPSVSQSLAQISSIVCVSAAYIIKVSPLKAWAHMRPCYCQLWMT